MNISFKYFLLLLRILALLKLLYNLLQLSLNLIVNSRAELLWVVAVCWGHWFIWVLSRIMSGSIDHGLWVCICRSKIKRLIIVVSVLWSSGLQNAFHRRIYWSMRVGEWLWLHWISLIRVNVKAWLNSHYLSLVDSVLLIMVKIDSSWHVGRSHKTDMSKFISHRDFSIRLKIAILCSRSLVLVLEAIWRIVVLLLLNLVWIYS